MHIYLEKAPGSGVLKYRGETGPNDDPDSFADLMGKKGLRVIALAEKQGDEIVLDTPTQQDGDPPQPVSEDD